MSRIQRPVMDPDHVFVPDENAVPHTRGVIEHNAAEDPEPQDAHDAERRKSSETEPHGMYWHRHNGQLVLKPHQWFLDDVARTADHVLALAVSECSDEASKDLIRSMASSLREYIECRKAINEMAANRKLKGEADDACYQLAQAAKYFIDATQQAQRCQDMGYNTDDNEKIKNLRARTEVAMKEGYMIAQAVILASDIPPVFDMKLAARRVVEYSCRKLTEWFAARRENEAGRDSHRDAGAKLDLESFLGKHLKRTK